MRGYRLLAVLAVVVSMSVAIWSSAKLASTRSLLALDRGFPRPVETELDHLRLVYPREMAGFHLSPAELSSRIAQAIEREDARMSGSDSESQKEKWELTKTCFADYPDRPPLMGHDLRYRMGRNFRLDVAHVMDVQRIPKTETARLVLRIASPGHTLQIMDLGTREVQAYQISQGKIIPVGAK